MRHRIASIVALLLTVAGCSGDTTPTSPGPAPSPASPAGIWSGSIRDPVSGEGTMRLSLGEQTPNTLTGTWSASFGGGNDVSGPAVATPVRSNAYGIILNAEPPPSCTAGASALLGYTLINVVVTPSRLTAVLGRTSCSGFGFGAVELSRQ